MDNYLLDTNILSYWYNDRCPQYANVVAHVNVVRRAGSQPNDVSRIFISPVTIGEIEHGLRTAPNRDSDAVKARQADFLKFVREQCPEVNEITRHVGESYGTLKAWLFDHCSRRDLRTNEIRLSQLIDPVTTEELGADDNDLWIAAQAMTERLVYVTNDFRGSFGKMLEHFSKELDDLKVENWAKP